MNIVGFQAMLRAFALQYSGALPASLPCRADGLRGIARRFATFIALAFAAGLAAPAAAQGRVDLGNMGLGEAQAVCRNSVNTSPWQSGIALAQPGRWWNPQRYGTGWDLVYSDDRTRLKVFLYTYNAQGHPVWLASRMTAIDGSGDFWTAELYEYTKSVVTGQVDNGSDVGEVYFRFFRDDPSRIAMRWRWNEIPAAAGQPAGGYLEECLNDMTRLNPTYYTGTAAPPQTEQLFAPQSSTPGLNPTFSGYWSDQGNVDQVPGVVMTVMQTSLGSDQDKFGEAAVWLSFNETPDGQKKRPVFLQAQRTTLRSWLPFESDTFDLYFHYATGYPHGFPTTDCSSASGCVSNQRIGSYTRSFRADSNYRRAQVSHVLDPLQTPNGVVSNPVAGRASVKLPTPGAAMTVNRMTRLQDISVNRYVCAPPAPAWPDDEPSCNVFVSWSGNGAGKPWKRDLGSMRYDAAPLSLEDIGTLPVALKTGDRFQFELWSGTPGSAAAVLLDRAPEVRGVAQDSASTGAIPLPPAAQISNAEDLPAHDASVGALAGSADVSGGAGTYTLPLQVPPGRKGLQPALALNYSSRAGNGVAGLGWSLSAASSIQRCPRTLAQDGAVAGVRLDGEDRLCLDGQRLVTAPGSVAAYGSHGAVYRTEIDSFVQITQSSSLAAGDVCFTLQQKDGRRLSYGCIPAGQQGCAAAVAPRVRPGGKSVELTWLLSRVEDPSGNTLEYCYAQGEDASETLLVRIAYTGSTQAGLPAPSRRVDFDYGLRPADGRGNDRSTAWIAGGSLQQTRRLTAVSTYSPDSPHPARRYLLDYEDTATTGLSYSYSSGRSLLRRVHECAFTPAGSMSCLRPTEFGWSDGSWLFASRKFTASAPGAQQPLPAPPAAGEERHVPDFQRNRIEAIGDVDGDGARELWIVKTWYDGTLRSEVQLAKVNADRVMQGSVTLSGAAPFLRAADVDGDGIAELIERSTIYKWKRGRGAPVCDGGAATCTAPMSSYFQVVATNLPAGAQDFIDAIADFNGDAAPDVLMRSGLLIPCPVSSLGEVAPDGELPTGCAPLHVYVNTRPGAIGSGTASFAFARSGRIGTLDAGGGSAESVQHVTDFDGDGRADVVIANASGLRRILLLDAAGTSVTASALDPGAAGFGGDTRQLRWLDVNGDGLDDALTVPLPTTPVQCRSGCYGSWKLQINRGGMLAAAASLAGDTTAGLRYDTVDGAAQLRYFGKLLPSDIDSDGRGDLLYPARFAARLCFGAYLTPQRFLTPRPAKDCPVQPGHGATCAADVCAAPPPEDEANWAAHPSGQPDAADAFRSGLGAYDPSVYRFNALRFVQTGANAFRLRVDETPVIAATSILGGQTGRVDDYFGDGMADVVSDLTCPLRPTTLFPLNTCHLYAGGTAGPGAADGSSPLDAAATIRMADLVSSSRINLLVNENQGDGARGSGLPPVLPDLMVTAVNGLNERAQWDYYPLSSSADRAGGDFPLYQIDAGYVDERHFLFQSTMPVVAQLLRSHAATGGSTGLAGNGGRSQRYAYGGAMYNREGRGFQGFRTIASETFGPAERRLRAVTRFHQKFPLTGRIESIETRVPQIAGSQGRLSLETQSWQCDRGNRNAGCPGQDGNAPAPGIHWPYLGASVKQVFDLARAEAGATPLLLSTTTTVNGAPTSVEAGWDAYGNLTYQQVTVQDGAGLADGERYLLASQVTTTVNAYDTSPAMLGQWWLDKLTTSVTQSGVAYHGRSAPAGIALAQKRVIREFSWNTDRTLALSTATDPYSGMTLQTAYAYPMPSAGQPVMTTVSGTGVEPPRVTRTAYTGDGYFVRSVSGVLSAANPALDHTVTTTLRASDGQPLAVQDANGVETRHGYDAFGRRIHSRVYGNDGLPLAPATETALRWCTPCSAGDEFFARYYQTIVADGAPSQRSWHDVLGREVKRATRGFDGRWVNVTTRYDTQGSVQENSAPHFDGETPLLTQQSHDRLDRMRTRRTPTAELNPAQGDMQTTYAYDGLATRIDVRPVAGNGACLQSPNLCLSASRQHDALGRLLRTTDAQNGVTDHWFDPLGNLAALRDANGHATLSSYNGFGQRLSSADPNQGNWSFSHNALNELLAQTDARGVRTRILQRDALGRVLQRKREPTAGLPAGLADETVLDTWVYDAAGVKGQLASVQRQRGSSAQDPAMQPVAWKESYGYWLNSTRLHTRTTTIEGGPLLPFTYTYQYDPYYGHASGVTYPNAPQPLTVWKRYTRYGALTGLVDARVMTPLWSMSQADAYGKPTQEQFGYALSAESRYARARGQMLGRSWRPFDRPAFVGNLETIDYRHDALGNLIGQERRWRRYDFGAGHRGVLLPTTAPEHAGMARESYHYDRLQRLLGADRSKHGLRPDAHGTLQWGEMPAEPAQVSYGYDAVGNIVAKTDHAGSYRYGDASTPGEVGNAWRCGPNALRQTVGAGLVRDYHCDRNGNQIREATSGAISGLRTLSFDGANLPTRIDHVDPWNGASFGGHISFAYGPDGARYSQIEDSGRRIHYGADGYEMEVQGNTVLHRVELGPVVYTRQVAGSEAAPALVGYQLRDRLGSTVAIADRWGHFNGNDPAAPFTHADGLLRRSFDPFGAPRHADFANTATRPELRLRPATQRGFTAHEHLDGSRLIHMNGRLFDYLSGRFLSVDPIIQSPGHSQSLNPYSYIGNNPLSGMDPSGYAACAEGSCNEPRFDNGGARGAFTGAHFSNGGGFAVPQLNFAPIALTNGTELGPVQQCSNPALASAVAPDQINGVARGVETPALQKTYERWKDRGPVWSFSAEIVAGTAQTIAAWQTLFSEFPAQNAVTGETVSGVNAWDERFLSALGLLTANTVRMAPGPSAWRAGADVSTSIRRAPDESFATKSAFEVAQAGGKHAGFLKNYLGRSPEEIQKAIGSIEKQIADHRSWIANPQSKIPNFSSLDPRQQAALVNSKWPGDIVRQQEQIDILRELLGGP